MSRYNTISPEPPPPAIDGDTRFTRLNMKADRATLGPGEYPLLENGRTNRGIVETRPGTITPVFANVVDLSGGILGASVYNNPNGLQTMLLALPDKVLQLRSGSYPREVAIPAGVTLAGTIEFVPEPTGHVIMFRGTELAPLVWDGVSTSGFAVITKLDPSDHSTTLIPNGETGVAFNNRLLIPVDGTNIAVSDVGDYSSYDAILDDFKVAGTSDKITRLFPFRQSTLVIFKEQTIWLLSNFTNTTVSDGSGGTIVIPGPYNAQLEIVSSTLGCIAPRGVTLVGGEPWFPDRTGLYALEEVFQENLKASPVPLTDLIQPLWDRINWSVADKIVAAVHGIRHYLAVPLDDSEVNNAVIVTNTETRGQESIDTWDAASGFQIDRFLVADYFGAQRLYAVNAGANKVHLLYEGKHDEV